MVIRDAHSDDADAICAIYNRGICERQATFETRSRVREDVELWFASSQPFIVAAEDGVLGWARAARYSERDAYRGVGEHAVYVHPDARGRGLGRQLLEALCATCEQAGFWKLTSRVFTTNHASLAAHRAAGFSEIGIQRRHGRLDGQWKDCVLVEILLGPALEP